MVLTSNLPFARWGDVFGDLTIASAWIAQLVEHGLVRPSFVPPPPIREPRDFTRYRRTLVEE
jgi:hypothetical protein